MGNRAVITTEKNFKTDGVGIYLHWNGGRDSVETFLKYCKLKGYRTPSSDCYGWAYLVATIANYFGDGLSVGIDRLSKLDLDNGDNGVYIIDGWDIVDRIYFDGIEQNRGSLDIISLNFKQPVENQLTAQQLINICCGEE